jgi:hypothetical protein
VSNRTNRILENIIRELKISDVTALTQSFTDKNDAASAIEGIAQVRASALDSTEWTAGWNLLNKDGGEGIRRYLALPATVIESSSVPFTSLNDLERAIKAITKSASAQPLLKHPLGMTDTPLYDALSKLDDPNVPLLLSADAFPTVMILLSRPRPFVSGPDIPQIPAGFAMIHQPLYEFKTDNVQVELSHANVFLDAQDRLMMSLGLWKTGIPKPITEFRSDDYPFVCGYIHLADRYIPWCISFTKHKVILFDTVSWESENVDTVSLPVLRLYFAY